MEVVNRSRALWLAGLLSMLAVAAPGAASGATIRGPGSAGYFARQEAANSGGTIADLLDRLRTVNEQELGPVLVTAYDAFRVETSELRLPQAESLALAMHDRARAGWSALSLALLSTRMGNYAQANRVLMEQLERTEARAQRAELLERSAIAAAGAGHRERSLDLLGRALVLGGRDAQQMLGRDALAHGDHGRARDLFSALLPPVTAGRAPYEAGEVPAWALRGWGLALLGPPADPVPPTTGNTR